MHPEMIAALARQHAAELGGAAEQHRRLGHVPTPLRTRLGRTLVRWGTGLAPPHSVTRAPAGAARRPTAATMPS